MHIYMVISSPLNTSFACLASARRHGSGGRDVGTRSCHGGFWDPRILVPKLPAFRQDSMETQGDLLGSKRPRSHTQDSRPPIRSALTFNVFS